MFALFISFSYGRPFVSKLAMTTLCKKWVTSRDNIDTSRNEFRTSRDEFHTPRGNCIASREAVQNNTAG